MQRLILTRYEKTQEATFGRLTLPDGTVLQTLELPDRGNARKISAIPAGCYICEDNTGAKYGYRLRDVPGRNDVLIHAGNVPGETEGCILVGRSRGFVVTKSTPEGGEGVRDSRSALALMKACLRPPFELKITESW